MRPARDLWHIQDASVARVERIGEFVYDVITGSRRSVAPFRVREVDAAVSFAVVELDNLWVQTARSLFLSSALGGRDALGSRVVLQVPRAADINEAMVHAVRACRPDKYESNPTGPYRWHEEPFWWKTRSLLDSLRSIGASNVNRVSGALSLSPSVFAYLHTFRNFYAHRSQGTMGLVNKALLRLGVPENSDVTAVLASPIVVGRVSRTQPLVLDWLDEMANVLRAVV